MRGDGRGPAELRPVEIIPDWAAFAEGSALIRQGRTHVLVTASVEEGVPPFLKGAGQGWLTAEYAMLPRSTQTRTPRETRGPRGRTQEIQRLIGRSLRQAVDLTRLGERTLTIDADVLQADGGTRTAAITAGWVAVALALARLRADGRLTADPLVRQIAAVSVGLIDGQPVLDLPYEEDVRAGVDVNVVMTDADEYVEVQGTGEHATFSRPTLDALLDLAASGIRELMEIQRTVLRETSNIKRD
jgi:ribonuclease PH